MTRDSENRSCHRLVAVACALALLPITALIAQPPEDLMLAPVTGGLISPVAVRHAGDGSGRLFIVEPRGTIVIYDSIDGLSTFLDIQPRVNDAGNEQGSSASPSIPTMPRTASSTSTTPPAWAPVARWSSVSRFPPIPTSRT